LLDVLEVQRNLYASQDALAQSDQAVSSDLVAIYKHWAAAGRTKTHDDDACPIAFACGAGRH